MDYPSSYPGSEVIDVEYAEVAQPLRSTGLSLSHRTSVVMRRVTEEAMVATTVDHCRAMLAKTGMEHIAALSAMEQQLSSMTPQSAARYREIVDAYAQQAADTIRGW